jgi:stage IV sporulation protein B
MLALLPAIYVGAKDTEIYVIPGGDSIGLQLSTGIYITGKYNVKTEKGEVTPWRKGNLEVGDKIVSINNVEVSKIEDVQKILSSFKEEQELVLEIKRGTQILRTSCRTVKDKGGKFTLGLYVKDEVMGVGTITYIDPNTKNFGALGHSMINEQIIGDSIGNLTASSIRGIRKSFPGIPGEKQATLSKRTVGTISKNIEIGVFGKVKDLKDFTEEKAIKVASPDEVRLGKAQMLTVLESNKKESFEVEVVEVKNQSRKDVKGIKIKITDEALLEKTGGIIQGMSGSPIIQDNKLIGAVSHGYCVYAMWMVNSF